MMKDGHFIDDPLSVVMEKPDFSNMWLTDEDRELAEAIAERTLEQQYDEWDKELQEDNRKSLLYDYHKMRFYVKYAIMIFGENRSLGNVAANIEAIIKNMEK